MSSKWGIIQQLFNMKFEFSAGGVVYKQEKILGQDIQILVAQHSYHHGWVFPKGLIGDKKEEKSEKGKAKSNLEKETKETAALREVEEETGAKGKIIQALTPTQFWYKFEGEKIKKTVYYFIMEYIGGDITKHDFEMEKVEWLPMEEVEGRLTFKSDKKVWREAREYLEDSI